MSFLFKHPRPVLVADPSANQAPNADSLLRSAIESIGRQSSHMGREAAEVRGQIEDAQKVSTLQEQGLDSLASEVNLVTQAQHAITAAAEGSVAAVGRARSAVEEVNQGVTAILSTLEQVSQAAQAITTIALQTRLVAFNASVEAKRAGDAGRTFGVVADAVKDLAGQVESASKEISTTVADLGARIDALSHDIRLDNGDGANSAGIQRALADVQQGMASTSAAADQSRSICADLNGRMAQAKTEMHKASGTLASALGRSESFLKVSESLIETLSNCGIETDDTPFIAAAQGAAAEISAILENALQTSAATAADLFDEHYVAIPRTQPQQHATRFVDLADRLFPEVQERLLGFDPKVVFCISVDRNGYVAAHNRKYSQPQRGDLAWDTANSRYRRIFNDRTGLASARNTRPFLLQTYRRDMGGGKFVVMKEVAAPITVNGRHWGAIRLAFHF